MHSFKIVCTARFVNLSNFSTVFWTLDLQPTTNPPVRFGMYYGLAIYELKKLWTERLGVSYGRDPRFVEITVLSAESTILAKSG